MALPGWLLAQSLLGESAIFGSGPGPPLPLVRWSEAQPLCDIFDKGCKELAEQSAGAFAAREASQRG